MANKSYAYYNEFDKKASAWLRQLIKNGLIADGEVDERSITEVQPNDLAGFTQHHFFAGIGGWSYALRLAKWPDSRPVWTASLPCQPFSVAGLQKGKEDERHLLPNFLELVRQCNPDAIFGEQVEGAIRHGWLDDLQTTMEGEGYTVGHCVLGAHSVGAFHQRQRLYWVADSSSQGFQEQQRGPGISCNEDFRDERKNIDRSSELCRLGNSTGKRYGRGSEDSISQQSEVFRKRYEINICSSPEWLYCRDNKYRPIKSGIKPLVDGVSKGMVHSGDPDNTQEARVMRLKGYGNAIVPQVAAEFIKAFMYGKN